MYIIDVTSNKKWGLKYFVVQKTAIFGQKWPKIQFFLKNG